MAVQKIIEYNSLDANGQILPEKYNLTLTVLENSGNYLIHRDILRHQLSQKQMKPFMFVMIKSQLLKVNN